MQLRLVLKLLLLALAGTGMSLQPSSVHAQASTGQIIGTVSDSAGAPLAGVRLSIDGLTLSAGSRQDGHYTIAGVPPGRHTIRARLLGFAARSQPVTLEANQTATVNFKLDRLAMELTRVVSTGYATQAKGSLTGATEVVVGEDIAKRPVSNVSKALQGTVPGLTMIDRGGAPGADGGQIRIRGVGTLGDNGALVLIDGVEGNLNHMDPLTIETITVLKDASSSAIYGSRAANGVILVTTKRGKNTGALKVNYQGTYTNQTAESVPQRVDIGTEMRVVNETYVNAGKDPKYRPGQIDSTVRKLDPLLYPNTSWLSLLYRTAPEVRQTVRVTGGNDLATLALSFHVQDQQGILTTDNYYQKLQLRANTDFNISKRLSAAVDLVAQREKVLFPNGSGDAFFRALHDTPPTVVAVYPDGSYGWGGGFGRNPVANLREEGYAKNRYMYSSLNARGSYQVLDGLTFRVIGSVSDNERRELRFFPQFRFVDRFNPNIVRFESIRSSSNEFRSSDINQELQATLSYERTIGSHGVRLLGGYDELQATGDNDSAGREGAYNNSLQLVSSGDINFRSAFGGAGEHRLRSTFARANYDFRGKYLLEANVRRDGSSRFGPGRRYGVFPSFSGAWRVSDEEFMRKRFGFITDLKLRGSWGRLGNERIGDYLYQQNIDINTGNYNFGGNLANGATPGRIANPNIGWESTEMTDAGLDLTVLDGKLSFTGDLYRKYTSGILTAIPVPALLGLGAPVTNGAEVSNKGWETSLTWHDKIRELNYSLSFNLSDVTNRIEKLPGGAQLGGTIRRVGDPIDAIFGLEVVGIFKTQAEVDAWAKQVPGKTGPGDLKYRDQNGDGKIDANDRVVIGNQIPRYTYGSTITAQYKQFDFSVLFQGVGKVDAYLEGALIEGPVWENFFPTFLLDYWRPDNLNARWPRFGFRTDINQNSPGRNSKYVLDASYLKLKNLNIGYAVPERLSRHIGLDHMRIYFTGSNLFEWSKIKALHLIDPEFPIGRATYYYQTRNIGFGTSFGI